MTPASGGVLGVENPAAFPCAPGDVAYWNEGMTLRDWFAGQALTGICAGRYPSPDCEKGAVWAYAMADAMLATRVQS